MEYKGEHLIMSHKKSTKLHWWKCQNCGLTFERVTKGEPRRCPMCKDKGVKSYMGYRERRSLDEI